MDEHDDLDKELSKQPPAEGVRIIRADEAQAALDAGHAEGRRPGDAPRYGDVPPPPPSGPRPAHRFPLPDSVDPSEVAPRPPIRIDEVRAAASRRIRETGMAASEEGRAPVDDHFGEFDDRWGPPSTPMSRDRRERTRFEPAGGGHHRPRRFGSRTAALDRSANGPDASSAPEPGGRGRPSGG
jgi:hypothetical protein